MNTNILERVDPDRLKRLTLDLLSIPSPTCNEREMSEFYADYLRGMKIDVELDYEFPDSPSVIVRIKGRSGGQTLQFDGHTDTIHAEHPAPCFKDGVIYGRGAADMKSSLAAMAEMARALVESGVEFKGEVLLTAHGRHEAPYADNETLESLISKGVFGDAVVVGEVAEHILPIVGKGMTVYQITVFREGPIMHETMAGPDVVNPIWVGHKLLGELRSGVEGLAQEPYEYIGPDSLFVGIFESGDFYNRVPQRCRIVGTRRHTPRRKLADIRAEFETTVEKISGEFGVEIQLSLQPMGEAFQLSEKERIVRAVRKSYLEVVGRELPLGGVSIVGNAPAFIHIAGVPAVYHGVDSTTAHADLEFVKLSDIVRAARVYIATTLNFLGP